MTITVTLNALGLLKALDVVSTARMEALRRRETEPRVVSVGVGVAAGPGLVAGPVGQDRVVDLIV